MTAGTMTSLDMRAIESILEMGGGYVLDLSNRTFTMFFADLGIDIDEDLAAKYPPQDEIIQWTQTRSPDGSPMRP